MRCRGSQFAIVSQTCGLPQTRATKSAGKQAGMSQLQNPVVKPNSVNLGRDNPGGIAESSRWLSVFCDTTGSYRLEFAPRQGQCHLPCTCLNASKHKE